jgi:glycosyltransferase involved in cell wall biosynthesis
MNSDRPSVAILMATYNRQRYITAQIRSILDQSWSYWKLYIRDDGSSDDTPAIASQFAREFPDRIFVFPSDRTRLGVNSNFSYLMEHVESDYVMFGDQDDVWLPEKVEKSLQCMQALEARHGAEIPLLIHTDLRVVDADLDELDPSVWHYGYHNPAFSQELNRLLVQNMVFGCSILINARLKGLAMPIPDEVVQYDWWLALVSVCLGRVGYISDPTALYRQHGENSVGAQSWGLSYVLRKCLRFYDREALVKSLAASRRQAAVLLDRYGEDMGNEQREMISAYAGLDRLDFLAKRKTLLKYGFLKTGLIRNIGLFLRI